MQQKSWLSKNYNTTNHWMTLCTQTAMTDVHFPPFSSASNVKCIIIGHFVFVNYSLTYFQVKSHTTKHYKKKTANSLH